MIRISFIMPTFNRAALITHSIESVLQQMGPQDELLVVDDGSTDSTAHHVRRVAEAAKLKNLKVRYHRQANAGKSVALNTALAMTTGRYVCICDDDDLFRPGAVEVLVNALEQGDAGVAFGRYTRFVEKNGHVRDLGTGYWPELQTGSVSRHLLEDAFIMHNAALVRRSAYEKVGPFDEALLRSQDYDMFLRLVLQVPTIFVDELIFEQRKHGGARGPARVRHAAGSSNQVWSTYDRRIFARLHKALPLSFYEAMFDAECPQIRRRTALLQRACVMGRHDMWSHAMDDLEAAAAILPLSPLLPLERTICHRAVAGKHGFTGAVAPDIGLRLRALNHTGGEAARMIVYELVRGTFWRFRQADLQPKIDALRLARFAYDVPMLSRFSWERFRRRRNIMRDRQVLDSLKLIEHPDLAPVGPLWHPRTTIKAA
ncbi:glycosyltransferase family 2 protein [Croceicoccus sp. F390]|uniref:Glycosyltransferase family 2 protein n=1 Tax=Croceicoccus esteveae TaxID=3075597 RepID=A0ABU2ZGW5_9SPHN|nr:glycosyltransferase family 2 protein [Croceicoccus sp. F390]MDT0575833.1 glycosyltransferase family 2 protein [Croceicoccus sp. F390]